MQIYISHWKLLNNLNATRLIESEQERYYLWTVATVATAFWKVCFQECFSWWSKYRVAQNQWVLLINVLCFGIQFIDLMIITKYLSNIMNALLDFHYFLSFHQPWRAYLTHYPCSYSYGSVTIAESSVLSINLMLILIYSMDCWK